MLRNNSNEWNDAIKLIPPKEAKGEYYGSLDKEDEDTDDEISAEKQEANYECQVTAEKPKKEEKFNFFSDGETRVDFVLVWKEDLTKESEKSRAEDMDNVSEKNQNSKLTNDMEQDTKWRNKFLKNLRRSELLMEMHEAQSQKQTIHYVVLNVPWKALCYFAENMGLLVPLQDADPRLPHYNADCRMLFPDCLTTMLTAECCFQSASLRCGLQDAVPR
ncbi:hypothetical protein scyTo_0019174 [Scyliorhinus torazame]|uniref:Anoctamin dimerisation domain-containing protein n=1 Tax=Scyliorhinus torazame TaxID=75743 RepID=A0A401PUA6_SCYTO|nr:hypothetical protein [Scyliorhinus torazame]